MFSDYRRLAGEMRDAYFLIQDARIVVLSSSELAKLGYEERGMVGKPFTSIFPPEVHQQLLENYERLLSGGSKTDRIFTDLITLEGERIPIEVSAWPTWYQGKPAIAGIVLDLSGREEAERALLESEEKLRVMLESISEGIAVIDLKSNILDMNPAMLRLYGYDRREDVIGMSAFEFIPVEYREMAREDMKKTLQQGYSSVLEIALVNRNGVRYDAEISAAPLRDRTGEPVGFVAITRDITERKRQEAENLRLEETLKFYSSQVVKASKELVHAIREVEQWESRVPPPLGTAEPLHGLTGDDVELLTGREAQVLQLVSRGLSNKAIGAELGITVRTVKGHLMSIYRKLKVGSRTEAVSCALREGWITLEDMGYIT